MGDRGAQCLKAALVKVLLLVDGPPGRGPCGPMWPFKVFTTASIIVLLCGMTQHTCSNVTCICTTDTIQELLIYQDSCYITVLILCAVCYDNDRLVSGKF